MREHNRIATQLAAINPSWSDESLFQEARRINIAIMQHITYNEWIPTLIGQSYAKASELLPIPGNGFFQGYNPAVKYAYFLGSYEPCVFDIY
jgi:peroxidase